MPTSDREAGVSAPTSADAGAAAWPPQEAAPVDAPPKEDASGDTPTSTDPPSSSASQPAAETAPADGPKPETAASDAAATEKSAPEAQAALPAQEMPFSNSTLHWLDDEAAEEDPSHRITVPGYDPTAPVAGRKRAVAVVGGAGALAVVITAALYFMAPHHGAPAAPTAAEPARDLTNRAEAALAANRAGDAMDLARLALVADPRFADAHFVVAKCDQARGENPGAREELRRYLELAPLGTHAAAAREALATLPP
jgi:hypothetical protein